MLALLALTRLLVGLGGTYATIDQALAHAHPGDTIEVASGEYRQAAYLIDRPVTLLGRGRPVLVGPGDRSILHITADDVTVAGFVLTHVLPAGTEDRAAIFLDRVRRCRIADNEIRDSFFGIRAARAADCAVVGNRIVGSASSDYRSGNAIHLWSSDRLLIQGNDVTGHRDGLYLEFVRSSRLTDNVSHGNRRYGMHFMFSDSCRYERNLFRDNGVGVAVMYTSRVTMTENRFEDNQGPAAYGLLLKDINDSRLSGNLFTRNTVGLYLEGSNRQEVTANRFVGNGSAVRVLANATDNTFTDNVFVGNAFDVTTNSRSATSRFEGNYWDHYRGFDLDRDGWGDVPYRPVRLFALVVEQNEPALILLRSVFVELLDQAERVLPVLTPELLIDARPRMEVPR